MSEQITPVVPEASAQPDAGSWDWLDSAGTDSATVESAGTETLDATVEAGAEVKEQATQVADESQTAEQKAEDTQAKPDEQSDTLEAKPDTDAGQEDAGRKQKTASFWDHYLNPAKPAEEVRQHLQDKSGSRYGELEQAVLQQRLADPQRFAADLFQRDKEAYGKLALEVFNADPQYFVQKLVGRDVDPKQISTALEFYERNKDGVPNQVLTKENISELREVFGDDPEWIARFDKLERGLAGDAAKPELPADVQAKLDEYDKYKAAEAEKQTTEQTEQQKAIQIEQANIWDEAKSSVESYITSKANEEYSLAVTDEERKSSPLVAQLKDLKRSLILHGMPGVLPSFEEGLTEWGKAREDFKEKLAPMAYYSDQRERENAKEAAQGLFPFTDKYMQERIKAPLFAQIDELIKLVTESSNKAVDAEEIITGSHLGSQTGEAGNEWGWLEKDAFQ